MKDIKKGMEQAIWIVITIVVALTVALILIIMFNSTSQTAQSGILENIISALSGIKEAITGIS